MVTPSLQIYLFQAFTNERPVSRHQWCVGPEMIYQRNILREPRKSIYVNKAQLTELAKHIKSTYPLAENLANYTKQWQVSVQIHQTRSVSLHQLTVQAIPHSLAGNRLYKIKTNYLVRKVMAWKARTAIKGSKGSAGSIFANANGSPTGAELATLRTEAIYGSAGGLPRKFRD